MKKEFYIDIDKSTANWTYSLRLRAYEEQKIGVQVATFNRHTMGLYPNLPEKIVHVLNKVLTKEKVQ